MKKGILLMLSLVLPTLLMAGPVGKDTAQEKAQSFLNGAEFIPPELAPFLP